MATGTNPSTVRTNTGDIKTAFQANDGKLWVSGNSPNSYENLGMGMWNSTSPSIAASRLGGYKIAFQSGGQLWVRGSDGGYANLGLGLGTGTSPSIAALSTGGYKIAFQANDGKLWVSGDAPGTYDNTQLGIYNPTSPSIAASPRGGYKIAFQSNGSLWLRDSGGGNTNLGLGMAAGTNPSITALSNGGYKIAFQANTGDLWVSGDAPGTYVNTMVGMKAGTSPAISATRDGGFTVSVQANTGQLWTWRSPTNYTPTGLGMYNPTSPARASEYYLSSWVFGGDNGSVDQPTEADAFITALRGSSDAAAAAGDSFNKLAPADRTYVTDRMDNGLKWSSSRTYGGANWKVDTDVESDAFTVGFRGAGSDAVAADLYSMLHPDDHPVIDRRIAARGFVDGGLYREPASGKVWLYEFGTKAWVTSQEAADDYGLDLTSATRISPGSIAAPSLDEDIVYEEPQEIDESPVDDSSDVVEEPTATQSGDPARPSYTYACGYRGNAADKIPGKEGIVRNGPSKYALGWCTRGMTFRVTAQSKNGYRKGYSSTPVAQCTYLNTTGVTGEPLRKSSIAGCPSTGLREKQFASLVIDDTCLTDACAAHRRDKDRGYGGKWRITGSATPRMPAKNTAQCTRYKNIRWSDEGKSPNAADVLPTQIPTGQRMLVRYATKSDKWRMIRWGEGTYAWAFVSKDCVDVPPKWTTIAFWPYTSAADAADGKNRTLKDAERRQPDSTPPTGGVSFEMVRGALNCVSRLACREFKR